MSPAVKRFVFGVIGICGVCCVSGCGTAALIGKATRAMETTSQSMNATRDVLERSGQTIGEMGDSLEKLREPMRSVAALAAPMRDLKELEPSLDRLGTRLEGMENRLQRLERPLENVAMLIGPLQDVGALKSSVESVTDLVKNPGRLLPAVVGVFAAWMGATFLGVYLGFRTGRGRVRRSTRASIKRS